MRQLARDLDLYPKHAKKADNKDDELESISKYEKDLEDLERLEFLDIRHDMLELKKAEIQRRLEKNRVALERLKKKAAKTS